MSKNASAQYILCRYGYDNLAKLFIADSTGLALYNVWQIARALRERGVDAEPKEWLGRMRKLSQVKDGLSRWSIGLYGKFAILWDNENDEGRIAVYTGSATGGCFRREAGVSVKEDGSKSARAAGLVDRNQDYDANLRKGWTHDDIDIEEMDGASRPQFHEVQMNGKSLPGDVETVLFDAYIIKGVVHSSYLDTALAGSGVSKEKFYSFSEAGGNAEDLKTTIHGHVLLEETTAMCLMGKLNGDAPSKLLAKILRRFGIAADTSVVAQTETQMLPVHVQNWEDVHRERLEAEDRVVSRAAAADAEVLQAQGVVNEAEAFQAIVARWNRNPPRFATIPDDLATANALTYPLPRLALLRGVLTDPDRRSSLNEIAGNRQVPVLKGVHSGRPKKTPGQLHRLRYLSLRDILDVPRRATETIKERLVWTADRAALTGADRPPVSPSANDLRDLRDDLFKGQHALFDGRTHACEANEHGLVVLMAFSGREQLRQLYLQQLEFLKTSVPRSTGCRPSVKDCSKNRFRLSVPSHAIVYKTASSGPVQAFVQVRCSETDSYGAPRADLKGVSIRFRQSETASVTLALSDRVHHNQGVLVDRAVTQWELDTATTARETGRVEVRGLMAHVEHDLATARADIAKLKITHDGQIEHHRKAITELQDQKQTLFDAKSTTIEDKDVKHADELDKLRAGHRKKEDELNDAILELKHSKADEAREAEFRRVSDVQSAVKTLSDANTEVNRIKDERHATALMAMSDRDTGPLVVRLTYANDLIATTDQRIREARLSADNKADAKIAAANNRAQVTAKRDRQALHDVQTRSAADLIKANDRRLRELRIQKEVFELSKEVGLGQIQLQANEQLKEEKQKSGEAVAELERRLQVAQDKHEMIKQGWTARQTTLENSLRTVREGFAASESKVKDLARELELDGQDWSTVQRWLLDIASYANGLATGSDNALPLVPVLHRHLQGAVPFLESVQIMVNNVHQLAKLAAGIAPSTEMAPYTSANPLPAYGPHSRPFWLACRMRQSRSKPFEMRSPRGTRF